MSSFVCHNTVYRKTVLNEIIRYYIENNTLSNPIGVRPTQLTGMLLWWAKNKLTRSKLRGIKTKKYNAASCGELTLVRLCCRMAARYLKAESSNLFIKTNLIFEKMINDHSGHMQICEDQGLYKVRTARKRLE